MTRGPTDPAAPDDPSALGPEARALLEAARGGDDPDPQDRARLRNAVRTAIAVSAAAPAAQAAAAASPPSGSGSPPVVEPPAGADVLTDGTGTGAAPPAELPTGPTGGELVGASAASSGLGSAAGAPSSGMSVGGAAATGGGAMAVPGLSSGLSAGGKLAALFAGALAVGGGVAVLSRGEDPGPRNVALERRPTDPERAEPARGARRRTAVETVDPDVPAGSDGRNGHGSPSSPGAPVAEGKTSVGPEPRDARPRARLRPAVGVTAPSAGAPAAASAAIASSGVEGARDDGEATDPGRTVQPAMGGSLHREAAALEDVQRALVHRRPSAALARLDRLDANIPDGQLGPERAFHRVLALCALDRTEDARAVARRLVAEDAFYAGRIRETCAASAGR